MAIRFPSRRLAHPRRRKGEASKYIRIAALALPEVKSICLVS